MAINKLKIILQAIAALILICAWFSFPALIMGSFFWGWFLHAHGYFSTMWPFWALLLLVETFDVVGGGCRYDDKPWFSVFFIRLLVAIQLSITFACWGYAICGG